MPIPVTIVLDSGSFLPMVDRSCEVGYFQCEESVSDIKIFVDGEELVDLPKPFKLCSPGNPKCKILVVHRDQDGNARTGGITVAETFHTQLLHLKDLYDGNHQPVEEQKFDSVIHFDSGHFCASMVKSRAFREHRKQPDGSFKPDPNGAPKILGPVSHNVVVHFRLEDGETLELARDGATIWTSSQFSPTQRIDVEIAADNTTAEKFFRHALSDAGKDSYWLPNQGDPPPSCPFPPCPTFP